MSTTGVEEIWRDGRIWIVSLKDTHLNRVVSACLHPKPTPPVARHPVMYAPTPTPLRAPQPSGYRSGMVQGRER